MRKRGRPELRDGRLSSGAIREPAGPCCMWSPALRRAIAQSTTAGGLPGSARILPESHERQGKLLRARGHLWRFHGIGRHSVRSR